MYSIVFNKYNKITFTYEKIKSKTLKHVSTVKKWYTLGENKKCANGK